MIIRTTAKLLNIAKIAPLKNSAELSDSLPGEWYASLVSTGRKGGGAIHFLHVPTMISVIVNGRSVKKAMDSLPDRAASLLKRNGFSELIPLFDLNSEPEFFTTNSRSVLATMTQMKYNIEYHLMRSEDLTSHDIDRIEDIHLKVLLGGRVAEVAKLAKGDYVTPLELLQEIRAKSD